MSGVTFSIEGVPVAQGRPRTAVIKGQARIFDPQKSKKEKKRVSAIALKAMRDAGLTPFQGPVVARIAFFFPCPKSEHRKKKPVEAKRHTSKPDLDNLAKLICDACNGVVYDDDSQVCDMHLVKIRCAQDDQPRVEVGFGEME